MPHLREIWQTKQQKMMLEVVGLVFVLFDHRGA
jgi:hypothetical protein